MTSRQRLIWFALGAFSSGALSVFAAIMLRAGEELDPSTISYLVLEEPISEAKSEADFDSSFIAFRTGEILRDCGARYFETTFLYDDHAPTADLPIIPANIDALPCVVLRSDEEGITIGSEVRWAAHADVPDPSLYGQNTAIGE